MTDMNTTEGAEIGAFERMLDTFGSDRTRWPAPARRESAGLLATSAEARARLKEAEALDRLLDLAPPPSLDTRALAARIVAAAAAEAPAASNAGPAVRGAGNGRARRPFESQWPAAALLAASLVLGIFSGFSGAFDPTDETQIVEASLDADIDPAQIALDGNSISMFEGDLL